VPHRASGLCLGGLKPQGENFLSFTFFAFFSLPPPPLELLVLELVLATLPVVLADDGVEVPDEEDGAAAAAALALAASKLACAVTADTLPLVNVSQLSTRP